MKRTLARLHGQHFLVVSLQNRIFKLKLPNDIHISKLYEYFTMPDDEMEKLIKLQNKYDK